MKKGYIKDKVVSWANKYELTRAMMNSYGVRTVVFTIVSFVISMLYGAYNLTLAIVERSSWFGVLAAYYVILAVMRGVVVVHHRKKRKAEKVGKVIENEKIKQIRKYRLSGILLVIMIFALTFAIMQMIRDHATFKHAGLMIYVSAIYSFYKITVAIINIVKARKQPDLTVQAVRNINMADALVSMLALQTSMINSFGQEDGLLFADRLNGATGAGVCALVLALGIYMIIKAQKRMKAERLALKNTQIVEEQDSSQEK